MGRGVPRLGPDTKGKWAGLLCGPGQPSPPASGSVRAQGLCQIPISCENSPDGHSTGHVYGMDGRCHRKCSFEQVGLRALARGRGAISRSAQLGVAGVLAGATGGSREWYVGGIPAGGGGSPALRTRTGQGTQHRP